MKSYKNIYFRSSRVVRHVLNEVVRFLILGLRPLLGPASCKYEIGCTQYTLNQLQEKPLIPAIIASAKRILSCW